MDDRNEQSRDSIVHKHGDLEIEENPKIQRGLWKAQRIGRAVWALAIAATLAGAFGAEMRDAVVRPIIIYFFLLVTFSIAGKRSMAEMDTFDMITLLIISEATQNALIRQNESLGYSMIAIVTLVSCTVFMAWQKWRRPRIEQFLQGGPVLLVEHGRLLRNRMKKAYVDEQDILMSAREKEGLERLDQIKYAILETSGQISVIKES